MRDTAPRICALVPAFNEEDRIASTLLSIASRREITRIYVIDDGSTDETQARVQVTGTAALVTQAGGNVGKGGALTAAYAVLSKHAPPFDIFLLLDADLGASASECVKLLPPLLSGDADMTVGTLPPDPDFADTGERGGFGLATGLARWAIRRRTGQTFAQPLSGQRAVRREVLDALGGTFAAGFGVEVALTRGALEKGFRVTEVPTEFRHNVTGGDWKSVWHRARQLLDVARAVLR